MSAEDATPTVSIDAQDRTAWHRMLRERDAAAHSDQADAQVADAVNALELRLARANATKHTLEQAIVLRDRLLREQQLRISELERDLSTGADRGGLAAVVSGARHAVGRARRAALRLVSSR
jgi:hypothetical protein